MSTFNEKDIAIAIADLSMLDWFPREPETRAAVAALLVRMVPSREALQWLVGTMVDRVGAWQGPKVLRMVLCDGGFTPLDGTLPYGPVRRLERPLGDSLPDPEIVKLLATARRL